MKQNDWIEKQPGEWVWSCFSGKIRKRGSGQFRINIYRRLPNVISSSPAAVPTRTSISSKNINKTQQNQLEYEICKF